MKAEGRIVHSLGVERRRGSEEGWAEKRLFSLTSHRDWS